MPVDDVRAVIDRVNKAATAYGPRWERDVTLRLAEALAGQEGLGEVAVAQAKRAERLLSDDDDAATRMKVLEAVARSLSRAGKPDEAKPYTAQITKLEARDYAEYAKTLPFKPEAFPGRKAKSDRAVLVEIFTGAECPPCVAVDLAFDGLLKAYKPADVILMQYHFHIPGPDPLTSPEAMKRLEEYYADQVRGAHDRVHQRQARRGWRRARRCRREEVRIVSKADRGGSREAGGRETRPLDRQGREGRVHGQGRSE